MRVRASLSIVLLAVLAGTSAVRAQEQPESSRYEYAHHESELPLEAFWNGNPPQSFEHALVLNGIGLDFGIHMGMIDALEDLGQKPDVLIGTCGGSVSAGIHQAFPDRNERLQFIASPEMHNFVTAPYEVSEDNPKMGKLKYLKLAFKSFLRQWKLSNRVLNYFPYKMANLPQEAIPERVGGPIQGANGIKYITLAARTDLTPENIKGAKIKGQKYYDEVLFTDPETAPVLENYLSPIGLYFPESLVRTETIVKSDQPFSVAIRMGVSDPYVFEPGILDDGRYLTGSINLNPVELVKNKEKKVTFGLRD
ncbi:MAG: patatin-like phospholipase family protein, partial [Bdellovibrionales bacterium]|nr:patatin-like phospholipase family protein [Bdellovibrionales bacterium]